MLLVSYVPLLCSSKSLGIASFWFVAEVHDISVTECHKSPTFSFPSPLRNAQHHFHTVIFFERTRTRITATVRRPLASVPAAQCSQRVTPTAVLDSVMTIKSSCHDMLTNPRTWSWITFSALGTCNKLTRISNLIHNSPLHTQTCRICTPR
jgi:hypothetical protein